MMGNLFKEDLMYNVFNSSKYLEKKIKMQIISVEEQ